VNVYLVTMTKLDTTHQENMTTKMLNSPYRSLQNIDIASLISLGLTGRGTPAEKTDSSFSAPRITSCRVHNIPAMFCTANGVQYVHLLTSSGLDFKPSLISRVQSPQLLAGHSWACIQSPHVNPNLLYIESRALKG
jgi:hypothetical protein